MRIERQARRSSLNPTYIACSCLTVLVGGGILLVVVGVFLLPGFILQLSGFESRGSTEALFDITPLPTVVVANPDPSPAQAVIDFGRFGSEPLNNNLYNYTLNTGSSETGARIAVVTFDESSLQAMCRQRSDICGPNNSQFRNARIDLKPGGGIVFGEVFIPQLGIWQNAGVVLQLVPNNRLVVAGIDVGGTLYAVPPNEFSGIVADVERVGNEAIQQMALEAGGSRYNLAEVRIDERTITLILR